MVPDVKTRKRWRWKLAVVAIRTVLQVSIPVGVLAVSGCIGVPVIKYSPVDQFGVSSEHKRTISVGCIEVDPRVVVRDGFRYEPVLTVRLRNPETSGEIAKVAVDSLQLHSLKFDIRRIDVQGPGGGNADTLMLHPRESAIVTLRYIGEWPEGCTRHELPADERLVIRISGIECNGEVIPARVIYYKAEH
jgi:hypothetical protein